MAKRKLRKLQDRKPGLASPRGAQVAAEAAIDDIFRVASQNVAMWIRMQPSMPSEEEIAKQIDAALDQIFGDTPHGGLESPFGQLLVEAVRKGQRDFLSEQAQHNIALIGEAPIKGAVANAIKRMRPGVRGQRRP